MSLPNIVLTGPPEMAEDHHIFGTAGPLGQCSKKLSSNPENMAITQNLKLRVLMWHVTYNKCRPYRALILTANQAGNFPHVTSF